jgi:uncharacterized protein (TIGR02246 family)
MTTRHSFVRSLVPVLVVSLVGVPAILADGPAAEQQTAIAKKAQAFVEAFHKGDADALAAFWTPDGDYVDVTGRVVKGRKAIAEDFARQFTENKGLTLRVEVASVRFPTPDTAIEDGVTTVMSPDDGVPDRARYTNFLVKKDGEWQLASVRESTFVPPSNYEHLRPLEWAIGEWVEDTQEPHVGRVLFQWTPDQNFIIGTRAVGVKDILLDNGSQRIGWDPAAKTIRSWSFEADGGFGHGEWKPDGDKWVVTMSSVLRSGSLMTATTVVTRVDADTITWQLKNQQLDGKAMPDTPVVKMKRAK